MRRFTNNTAQVQDVELHGFWHRRREMLIITGITINGITAATTTGFWLSICRQLQIDTQVFHAGGPAAVLRLFTDRLQQQISFCVEWDDDGTTLLRTPRVHDSGVQTDSDFSCDSDNRRQDGWWDELEAERGPLDDEWNDAAELDHTHRPGASCGDDAHEVQGRELPRLEQCADRTSACDNDVLRRCDQGERCGHAASGSSSNLPGRIQPIFTPKECLDPTLLMEAPLGAVRPSVN